MTGSIMMNTFFAAICLQFLDKNDIFKWSKTNLIKNIIFFVLGFIASLLLFMTSIYLIDLFFQGSLTIDKLSFELLTFVKILCLTLSVSVFEEALFRGILIGWLKEKKGKSMAFLISLAAFTLPHMIHSLSFYYVFNILAAGIFLGTVYLVWDTLVFNIAFHMMWNIISAGLGTLDAKKNNGIFSFLVEDMKAFQLIVAIILIVLALLTVILNLIIKKNKRVKDDNDTASKREVSL